MVTLIIVFCYYTYINSIYVHFCILGGLLFIVLGIFINYYVVLLPVEFLQLQSNLLVAWRQPTSSDEVVT